MSPSVQKVAPAQFQPAPALTTPQTLKLGLAGIWVTSLLLMTALITGARGHSHEIQVIGVDSAPSIIHSLRIRTALADMDAHAASESRDVFETRRQEAVTAIVDAAKNITYDAERKPIEMLALGLSTYTAQVQAARDRHDTAAWRDAEHTMDATLLPAATALDKANRTELDRAYQAQDSASGRAMALLILSGLLAGVVLIAVQFFIAARMRRVINPLLFLATLATLVFVIDAGRKFRAAGEQLRIAKVDAYDSLSLLWQARATGYSASGDLARAALDPAQKAAHEAAFAARVAEVSGHLADELRNITFPGEGPAAQKTAELFAVYRSTRNGADFKAFDDALGKTIAINQEAFDRAVRQGFEDAAHFEIVAPAWALGIAVLAWFGLRPRIREYSA